MHFIDLSSDMPHYLLMEPTISLTIRIKKSVKSAIKASAEQHSRSLNNHVVTILEQFAKGDIIAAEQLLTDPANRHLIRAVIKEALGENGAPKLVAKPKRKKAQLPRRAV